jgi:hypothetical protein
MLSALDFLITVPEMYSDVPPTNYKEYVAIRHLKCPGFWWRWKIILASTIAWICIAVIMFVHTFLWGEHYLDDTEFFSQVIQQLGFMLAVHATLLLWTFVLVQVPWRNEWLFMTYFCTVMLTIRVYIWFLLTVLDRKTTEILERLFSSYPMKHYNFFFALARVLVLTGLLALPVVWFFSGLYPLSFIALMHLGLDPNSYTWDTVFNLCFYVSVLHVSYTSTPNSTPSSTTYWIIACLGVFYLLLNL